VTGTSKRDEYRAYTPLWSTALFTFTKVHFLMVQVEQSARCVFWQGGPLPNYSGHLLYLLAL